MTELTLQNTVFYVIHDNVTGDVLFEGMCPELDLPVASATVSVLQTTRRYFDVSGWRVINGLVTAIAPPGPPPGVPATRPVSRRMPVFTPHTPEPPN